MGGVFGGAGTTGFVDGGGAGVTGVGIAGSAGDGMGVTGDGFELAGPLSALMILFSLCRIRFSISAIVGRLRVTSPPSFPRWPNRFPGWASDRVAMRNPNAASIEPRQQALINSLDIMRSP